MAKKKNPDRVLTEEMKDLVYHDLFLVEGVLVDRFNQALEHITKKRTQLKSFHIDKRGKSPEVIEELGVDYLNIGLANRFLIIVSPDQRHAPLLYESTSYDNALIDMMYTQNTSTIHQITQREALFAEIDDGQDVFSSIDDLLNIKKVQISLDTPAKTIGRMKRLMEMSDNLGKNEHIFDNEYINKMLALVEEVGDARKFVFPSRVKKQVNNFHVDFFGGVYYFRGLPHAKKDCKQFFITREEGFQDNYPKTCIMNISSPELVDKLHEHGLLEYSVRLIDRRQYEMESELLLRKDVDATELNELDRKRLVSEYSSGLSKPWKELQKLKTKLTAYQNGGVSRRRRLSGKDKELLEKLNPVTKIKLSVPKTERRLMNHLLCEMDPTDIGRLFTYNRNEFVRLFGEYAENKKRYVLHSVNRMLNQQNHYGG